MSNNETGLTDSSAISTVVPGFVSLIELPLKLQL